MVWKKKTADTAVPEENAEAAAGEDRDKEITEADKQELLEKFDKESKTRTFVSPAVAMAYKIFAILVTLYHLVFASGFWMPETLKHRSLHVSMILILAFAMYPATKKASRKIIAWYDYILIALSAAVPLYMWLDYFNIINRAGKPNSMDVIIGTLLTLLVLEATRRVCGMALPILGVIFILYSLMGTKQGLIPVNIPGIFLHRGYTWQKLMSHFFANTEGIYGSSVNVASTYIFLFIAFGEIMNKCGMGKFFNDIANALAGGSKGGPAKVAVVASGLLGMINGAAVAVVVTTGSFTIPLMKKTGYRLCRRTAHAAGYGRGRLHHGRDSGHKVQYAAGIGHYSCRNLLYGNPASDSDACGENGNAGYAERPAPESRGSNEGVRPSRHTARLPDLYAVLQRENGYYGRILHNSVYNRRCTAPSEYQDEPERYY